jgi:hypothetical protein
VPIWIVFGEVGVTSSDSSVPISCSFRIPAEMRPERERREAAQRDPDDRELEIGDVVAAV